MRNYFLCCFFTLGLSACSVITVADAAITVVATTVKVGAKVVETTVDVAASGVRAVTGSGDQAAQ